MTAKTIHVKTLLQTDTQRYQTLVDHVGTVNHSMESLKEIQGMLELGLNDTTRHCIQTGLEEIASPVTLPADTNDTGSLAKEIRSRHEELVTDAYQKLNTKLAATSTLLIEDISPLITQLQSVKTSYLAQDAETFVFENVPASSALTVDNKLCAFEEDSWDSLVSLVRFIDDLHDYTPNAIGAMIAVLKAPTDLLIERLRETLTNAPVLDGRLTESFCDDLKTKIPAIERTDVMSGLEVTQFQMEDWKEGTPEDVVKQFPYTHCIQIKDRPTQSPTTTVEISKVDLVESIDHATSVAKAMVKILSTDGPKFVAGILNDNPELFISQQTANLYYVPIVSTAIRLLQIVQEYTALVSALVKQDLNATLESFEF